jgi:hypothetical protein
MKSRSMASLTESESSNAAMRCEVLVLSFIANPCYRARARQVRAGMPAVCVVGSVRQATPRAALELTLRRMSAMACATRTLSVPIAVECRAHEP